MSEQFTVRSHAIEVNLDALAQTILDVNGAAIEIYSGDPVRFRVALKTAGGAVADFDASNITALSLSVKKARNGGAPLDSASSVMSRTLAAGSIADSITADGWADGTEQHATFDFDDSETPIEAGTYWLILSGVIETNVFTAAIGSITAIRTGGSTPTDAPSISAAYTRAQADAIFSKIVMPDGDGAPTAGDDASNTSGNGVFKAGDVWLDQTNSQIYVCLDSTTEAAVWLNITAAGGSVTWGSITGTLSSQTDLQNALNAKANTSSLGSAAAEDTDAFATAAQGILAASAVQPGDLGSAAALDVASSGDAASDEVVKGDDSRLSNSRTPTAHTHTLSEISDAGDLAALDEITAAAVDSGAATNGQVLKANGSGGASWQDESGGGLAAVVDDTSPQLGGNFDLNGHALTDATQATATLLTMLNGGGVQVAQATALLSFYISGARAFFKTNQTSIEFSSNARAGFLGGDAFGLYLSPNLSAANSLYVDSSGAKPETSGYALGGTANRWGNIYGQGLIELKQISTPSSPATDCARIYAKDTSGTAEVFVMDEAGNETQLSPHAAGAPEWFYDIGEKVDHVYYSANHYLGRIEWTNETRKASLLQRQIFGEDLSAISNEAKTFYFVETFEEYNWRCGLTQTDNGYLTARSWDSDQTAKQAAYEEDRNKIIQFNKTATALGKSLVAVPASTDVRKPKPIYLD